ncbi:DUF2336 domain-containing protein [Roseospira visakhapatnamensis]|uniref:Uncharacterized protein (DUF2336 family) n=1 Tax=Roseospira visakhapatnamensis TaxID=390880 RepID=A0A7W6WAY9_9PROT|nr:DUF2336 domain-containing protein [Roseospira visakhapatnamensis]MBB4267303.1 uncharacterized protein (DUF2336 family) [Roseospira visakhapatnamensis]
MGSSGRDDQTEEVNAGYLLALARKKTVASRTALAQIIASMFERDADSLNDREFALMSDILRRVLKEIEVSVRRRIAAEFASRPDVPRDLLTFLANDEIDVAYPVLSQSRVLRDADLIEVIHNRTLEHQLAVAVRCDVSEAVSSELVNTGNEAVITELLKNPDARLSRTTLGYLVEQSRRVDAYREPILSRRELPGDLAKRMVLWVSAALRTVIVERFALDPNEVDELIESAALNADGATADDEAEEHPTAAERLAEELRQSGQVGPDMMISALQNGEVSLFITLFAQATDLREILVRRLLFEPGGEGLAIACKAMDFAREDFSVIFLFSRKARPVSGAVLRDEHKMVMDLYDRMPLDACRAVMARWRRDRDYLKALLAMDVLGKADDETDTADDALAKYGG